MSYSVWHLTYVPRVVLWMLVSGLATLAACWGLGMAAASAWNTTRPQRPTRGEPPLYDLTCPGDRLRVEAEVRHGLKELDAFLRAEAAAAATRPPRDPAGS